MVINVQNSSSATTLTNNNNNHGTSMYVKVKMEGMAIARKVDLTLHHSYPSLKNALITMFTHCKFYSTFPDISTTQLFNYPKKRFFFFFFYLIENLLLQPMENVTKILKATHSLIKTKKVIGCWQEMFLGSTYIYTIYFVYIFCNSIWY